MRIQALALSAMTLALVACEKTTTPDIPPTYHLNATVTAANTCAVSVLDTNYSSIGQIRGDTPAKFVGTVNDTYHGFGCWVSTSGGDGDLIVIFSGNNLGKPLAPGTYALARQIYNETPRGFAAVSFRPSSIGEKLRTMDGAAGNVIVEDDGKGGLTIRVEAEVVRWGEVF